MTGWILIFIFLLFVEVGVLGHSFFHHQGIFSGDSFSIFPGNNSIDPDVHVKVDFLDRFLSGFIVPVFCIVFIGLEGLDCFQALPCFRDIFFLELVFLLVGVLQTVIHELIFLVGIYVGVKDSEAVDVGDGGGNSSNGLYFLFIDGNAPISFKGARFNILQFAIQEHNEPIHLVDLELGLFP